MWMRSDAESNLYKNKINKFIIPKVVFLYKPMDNQKNFQIPLYAAFMDACVSVTLMTQIYRAGSAAV